MTAQVWAFAGILTTAVFTFLGIMLREVMATKRLARPTGNGFAARVTEALARIEERQVATEHKLDAHIEEHVRASFWRH